jgi:hypothetical protein
MIIPIVTVGPAAGWAEPRLEEADDGEGNATTATAISAATSAPAYGAGPVRTVRADTRTLPPLGQGDATASGSW